MSGSSTTQKPKLATWLDRCSFALHNLTANRRFRDWAAKFPLSRPIARRRASQLFDLCAGFVYSQILLACVRLKLFDILAVAPQTAESLARRLDLDLDATLRLLDGATALNLLMRTRHGLYALGALGAAMVDNAAVAAMVEHHAVLYADLHDPVAVLRGTAKRSDLARYWGYSATDKPQDLAADQVSRYSGLMTASQPLVADEIIDAYPLRKHRSLLDVGGGEGAFVSAVAGRVAGLKLAMFDLPAVAELAKKRIAATGLSDRITVHGGSFLSDPIPKGADVISLVRVLHDHDDDTVRVILRAVRAALPDHGVLLIAEPMSGAAATGAMADAYFGFYLLAMGRGRARTPQQLGNLLQECGFDAGRPFRTHLPIQTRVLAAKPLASAKCSAKWAAGRL